jgi:hypothetical protein
MVEIPLPIIPSEIPKKSGFYKGKPVEEWTWKDFQNYYEDRYTHTFSIKPASYKAAMRKKQIEYSFELRGKALFKAMIDWLISHPKYSVTWTDANMSLIVGNHAWAREIAERAKKSIGKDLDNPVDEL